MDGHSVDFNRLTVTQQVNLRQFESLYLNSVVFFTLWLVEGSLLDEFLLLLLDYNMQFLCV